MKILRSDPLEGEGRVAYSVRRRHRMCSIKKTSGPATLLKEPSQQVFSSEYCQIFKNIYFEERM